MARLRGWRIRSRAPRLAGPPPTVRLPYLRARSAARALPSAHPNAGDAISAVIPAAEVACSPEGVCGHRGSRSAAERLELQVAEHDAAEDDHVPVPEVGLLDSAAVHERAVGAAVVEDPGSLGRGHEDRVPARNRALVEMEICREPPTDAQGLAAEGDH